ncbi:hypothetical protein [Bosea sp. AAP35]|uniref:hypothetical protein n=1 Tax=Bosea sp. AAP35 TaxID=1523417 RepID=UPI0012E22654|nr:hypothetical protein [Bosea sp. AAP35]
MRSALHRQQDQHRRAIEAGFCEREAKDVEGPDQQHRLRRQGRGEHQVIIAARVKRIGGGIERGRDHEDEQEGEVDRQSDLKARIGRVQFAGCHQQKVRHAENHRADHSQNARDAPGTHGRFRACHVGNAAPCQAGFESQNGAGCA